MDDITKRKTLRELLAKKFNKSELKDLCFDLGIDYEDLSGNKSSKVVELLNYCERAGKTNALIRLCFEMRPHVDPPFSWLFGDTEEHHTSELTNSKRELLFGLHEEKPDTRTLYSEAIQSWLLGDLGTARALCHRVYRLDPNFPGLDTTIGAIQKELRRGYTDVHDTVLSDEVMRVFSEGRQAFRWQYQPLLALFFMPQVIKGMKLSLAVAVVVLGVAVGTYFGVYRPETPKVVQTLPSAQIVTRVATPVTGSTPIPSPLPVVLTPTLQPFAEEAEGEVLIVIATFYRPEGMVDDDVHGEIQRAIEKELTELGVNNIRVEIEPTVIESGDQATAERLGNLYKASMIVWGTVTRVRVEVNFLNLKEPDFDAAEANINETERTQLAQPEAYAQSVVNDLPKTISFLALFAVGQSYYVQADYESAIVFIQEAVELVLETGFVNPELELENAYFRLGWLFQTTKHLNEAIANYDQAIILNPQFAEAFNNRGNAYANLGEYELAIADYDRAIELDLQYANAYNNRGNAYANLGGYELAIADYDRAIELNPQLAVAYLNRAIAHRLLGNHAEALSDFQRYLELNPQSAQREAIEEIITELQTQLDQ